MRIAITTPSGHIGSKVTELLLEAQADLVLLTRNPSKVERFSSRGVPVLVGSLDDAAFVTAATKKVDALLWVTPPNYASPDLRDFQRRCGRAAAQAIQANRISRIVNLSSIGAHLGSGVGPVSGLYDVEKMLDTVSRDITHLRPGYFFENYLMQVESIRESNSLFLPVSGSRRIPMIATRDIAQVAAQRLLNTTWTGRSVRGLQGPRDLSFDEAAELISRGTGLKIRHVKVPEGAARQHLMGVGLSSNVTDLLLEMYRAIESGTMKPAEVRTTSTTTPTTLDKFALEVIAPMVTPVHVGA
jgi:uncharacterized protein YbjT (DUF2867 family)